MEFLETLTTQDKQLRKKKEDYDVPSWAVFTWKVTGQWRDGQGFFCQV